jgi:hypothetical protein
MVISSSTSQCTTHYLGGTRFKYFLLPPHGSSANFLAITYSNWGFKEIVFYRVGLLILLPTPNPLPGGPKFYIGVYTPTGGWLQA